MKSVEVGWFFLFETESMLIRSNFALIVTFIPLQCQVSGKNDQNFCNRFKKNVSCEMCFFENILLSDSALHAVVGN